MAELELRCLGRLEVRVAGAHLNGVRTEKTRALLCFLAVSGQEHSRAELAGLFWSDLPEEDARANLRVSLANLRKLLPEYLLITRDAVAFNLDAPFTLDVKTFEKAFSEKSDLSDVVALYRGEFLEGLYLSGAELFDEWVVAQRERLRQLALRAFQVLADDAIRRRDYTTGAAQLMHLLALDPWREGGHRQLMLVYAYQGRREAALAQYTECCRVLAEELGLEPTEETTQLYEQVRSGQLGPQGKDAPAQGSKLLVERRHVTLLVAELLVDSALDPEDLSDQVATFQDGWSTAVGRFGGSSPDSQGVIQTAYFGFPEAHEDDPRRATLAALALSTQMSELHAPLEIRLAVHSGAVVVTLQNGTVSVVGLPLLVAQRLCGAGQAGGVLLSGTTEDLSRGYFMLSPETHHVLEGITDPVVAYRVLGETGARSRLQVTPPKVPMVGRHAELAALEQLYGEVLAGTGRAVLVLGDAGIGKSRLLFNFRSSIQDELHTWVEIQGVSYQSSTPYYPLTTWLEHELGFRSPDDVSAKLELLRFYLNDLDLPADELLLQLATLLSLSDPFQLTISPERWRQETLTALTRLLLAKAASRPLVLAFEDAHWYDASTLEILQLLSNELATSRVLLILTSRAELGQGAEFAQSFTRLLLRSLSVRETLELVGALAGDAGLSPAGAERLVAMSDGVPLYVEELLRASRNERSDTSNVPLTLQDALTARLDQSGDAREVAQFASVLGKTFSSELLTAASPFSESDVRRALDQLITTGLVISDDHPNGYTFKHALVQEAAYDTLLKRQRQRFHEQVARTLEQNADALPELLAHHYSGALLYAEAVQAWQRASEGAFARFAYPEAIQHLEAALALLTRSPQTFGGGELELLLVLKLGGALHVTQGYASAEVKRVYERAWELCRSGDLSEHLFPILLGRAGYHLMRAEFAVAEDMLRQLFALPPERLASRQLGELEFMAGRVSTFQGKLVQAQRHFMKVLAQKNGNWVPPVFSDVTSLTDIQVTAMGQSAIILWLLGYPDRALKFALQTIARDSKNTNLHRRASSLSFGFFVHFNRGEPGEAKRLLEAFMRLVSDQITTSWRAAGQVWQGAFAVTDGLPEGLKLIQEGLVLFDASGTVTQRPFLLWHYASSLERLGQNDSAFEVIEKALQQCQATGERWWEAELLRLKGTLLEQEGDTIQAAACFYQGIAVAQAQQAKSLELRSRCSLAKLNRHVGGPSDSGQRLVDLFGWFTEGFDTRDLRHARDLLDRSADLRP